jgi:hypothetical protein
MFFWFKGGHSRMFLAGIQAKLLTGAPIKTFGGDECWNDLGEQFKYLRFDFRSHSESQAGEDPLLSELKRKFFTEN